MHNYAQEQKLNKDLFKKLLQTYTNNVIKYTSLVQTLNMGWESKSFSSAGKFCSSSQGRIKLNRFTPYRQPNIIASRGLFLMSL